MDFPYLVSQVILLAHNVGAFFFFFLFFFFTFRFSVVTELSYLAFQLLLLAGTDGAVFTLDLCLSCDLCPRLSVRVLVPCVPVVTFAPECPSPRALCSSCDLCPRVSQFSCLVSQLLLLAYSVGTIPRPVSLVHRSHRQALHLQHVRCG